MEKTRICEVLRETCYLVRILRSDDDGRPEHIGWGSAVSVNTRGDLLTAAHVVTTRLPITDEDVHDPRMVILAKKKGETFRQYSPLLCGLSIHLDGVLEQPLTVDLAVLRPIHRLSDVPNLSLCTRPPVLGESVVMAGYPDDIELPFAFDELLPAANRQVQAQQDSLEVSRKLMMMRSGMIGHISNVTINEFFTGQVFHIDNVLHSGASGGPVVDKDTELLGIVTKRAITRVPYEDTPSLRVPSGAAVAITPQILLPKLHEFGVIEQTT